MHKNNCLEKLKSRLDGALFSFCVVFSDKLHCNLQKEALNGKIQNAQHIIHIFFSSLVSHYSPIITATVNGCDALLLSLLCISFNLFTAIIGADN